MLKSLMSIFIGGGLGASSRWALSKLIFYWSFAERHPWVPIMTINVLGSLILGFCYVLLVKHFAVNILWRNAILIGFLGGFTTFSSFSLNVMVSLEFGNIIGAIANIVLSVMFSLLACAAGISLAKAVVSL